ncbi:MAG: AAA family ATPase, partial [Opitutae bacterium]|nr:AAA family ATPase [Opitutae bacterium]
MAEKFKEDDIKNNLVGLLEYAKALYEIRSKTFSDYLQPANIPILNIDLKGYENVSFNDDIQGDAWISIKRVERIKPPRPPEGAELFLSGVSLDDPKEEPKLRVRAYRFFGLEEATDLIEADLASTDSFYFEEGISPTQAERVKGELHLEKFFDLQQVFRKWVQGVWKNWSEEQLRLESQIKLYRKYFNLLQQLRQKRDEFELVIGQNLIIARGADQSVVRAPVLEWVVELTVDEGSGYALLVTPKDEKPRVIVEPFGQENLPGSRELKGALDSLLAQKEEEALDAPLLFDNQFSEHVAGTVAALLHPEAQSCLDSSVLPKPENFPACTNLWVLLVRPKSQQSYIEDIDDLCAQVKELDEDDLPSIAISFGSKPKDEKPQEDEIDLSKLSKKIYAPNYSETASPSSPCRTAPPKVDTFFPLPANDEQTSILQLLENNDAVAVQGPPGTGKSHTIANIIAHYIATGRRVLVSAKTAEALSGVRDHLPKALSNLIISLVSSDADGKEQVEKTVRHIARVSQTTNKNKVKEDIHDYSEKVLGSQNRISDIDEALTKYARKHLDKIEYKGKTLTAVDIVKQVLAGKEEHAWFPDELGLGEEFNPQFSDSDISEAREIRILLKENILHHADQIFSVTSLPDTPKIKTAHERLVEGNILSGSLISGELPEPAENTENFHNQMLECSNIMRKVANVRALKNENLKYSKIIEHWFSPTSRPEEVQEIDNLLEKLFEWNNRANKLTFQRVNIDEIDWKNVDLFKAVKKIYFEEKNPFGIFSSLLNSKTKDSYKAIRVRDQFPTSKEEWNSVYQSFELMHDAEKLVSHWNGLCPMFLMPELSLNMKELKESTTAIEPFLEIGVLGVAFWKNTLQKLRRLFPYGIDINDVAILSNEFEKVYDAIEKWRQNEELKSYRNMPKDLMKLAGVGKGPIFAKLKQFANELGRTEDTSDLGNRWRSFRSEVTHLNDLKPKLDKLVSVSKKISKSGAKNWGSFILEKPVSGDIDPFTPSNWFDSWEHARANGFVTSLPSRQVVESLAKERSELIENLSGLLPPTWIIVCSMRNSDLIEVRVIRISLIPSIKILRILPILSIVSGNCSSLIPALLAPNA